MADLKNMTRRIGTPSQGLAPQARTASANGSSVDLAGYEGAQVLFLVGTITDGTHTPRVEESNDNSSFTTVAAGDLEGSLANLASNTPQKVNYRGSKRFIRAATTVSGATTGGVYGAAIIRTGAHQTPAP